MAWERIRSSSFLTFSSYSNLSAASHQNRKQSCSEALLLLEKKEDDDKPVVLEAAKPGWKAMPYILGNEAVEKMATYGLMTNLMVYLVRECHMDQVFAANLISFWTYASSLFTVVGAARADTYLGKFRTILFASFASLLGMVTITLTAIVPQLRPPPCNVAQNCISNTKTHLWFLLMGLGWLGIGSAGIRPCSMPFGIDQFDSSTVEGRLATHSFLNWYYTLATALMMINQVFVVYIQDSVSWALEFGIPTLLMMLCAIPMFLVGSNIYVLVKPEGSILFSFAQVLVSAYKKWHLKLHDDERAHEFLLHASLNGNAVVSLNKAALVVDDELKQDGSSLNPWRVCTIQHVEHVICVIKSLPIWASGGILLIPLVKEGTFMVSQALDRHIGTKFQMPAGSIKIMSMIAVIIWFPLNDRHLQSTLRKITRGVEGIPTLVKLGMGYIFAVLSMLVAGFVERQRRALATLHGGSLDEVAPMSVFWLFPQLMLVGFSEVFGGLGHIEFYNKEIPEKMRSIWTSLVYLCLAGATYLSSFVVSIVHGITGTGLDRPLKYDVFWGLKSKVIFLPTHLFSAFSLFCFFNQISCLLLPPSGFLSLLSSASPSPGSRSFLRAVNSGSSADRDYAVDFNATNFDAVLRDTPATFVVVEFFALWCPACRNYKPHYEKVARLFNGPDAVYPGMVLMTRVDCASKINTKLCDNYSVSHYPMLFWGPPSKFVSAGWEPKQEKSELRVIDNGRTADRLLNWISQQLGSSFRLDDQKFENDNLPSNVSDPGQIARAVYDVEEATSIAFEIILEHKSGLLTDRKTKRGRVPWEIFRFVVEMFLEGIGLVFERTAFDGKLLVSVSIWNGLPTVHGFFDYSSQMFCRGSKNDPRGFSCGLWFLLHSLSVRIDDGESNFTFTTICEFVHNFFICEECR